MENAQEMSAGNENDRNSLTEAIIKIGDKNDDVVLTKLMLNWIGYGHIQLTSNFGDYTKRRIETFQRDINLPVTGYVNHATRVELEAVFNQVDTFADKPSSIRFLKRTLNEIGFDGIKTTNKLGRYTIQRLKEFQTFYGLEVTGNVNSETIQKINDIMLSPLRLGAYSDDVTLLKINLKKLGYIDESLSKTFNKQLQSALKKYQKGHHLPVSGIADHETLKHIAHNVSKIPGNTYVFHDITFDDMLKMQETVGSCLDVLGEHFNKDGRFTTFFDPKEIANDKRLKYLLFNLKRSNIVDKFVLKSYLKDKSVLADHAEAFIEAGIKHGVNELWLVAHALLTYEANQKNIPEIQVDQDQTITYLQSQRGKWRQHLRKKRYHYKKSVYNFFENAFESRDEGAIKAFENDWNTPEIAIIEGAKLIKEKYLSYNQHNFYDMIWDPATAIYDGNMEPPHKTDLELILKQMDMIYDMCQNIGTTQMFFSIPMYENMNE